MLPLDVIRKYYPDLSEEELKKIQVFVYELCCGLMQYFYGDNWEEDMGDPELEDNKDRCSNPNISSNPDRVLGYRTNFNKFSTKL